MKGSNLLSQWKKSSDEIKGAIGTTIERLLAVKPNSEEVIDKTEFDVEKPNYSAVIESLNRERDLAMNIRWIMQNDPSPIIIRDARNKDSSKERSLLECDIPPYKIQLVNVARAAELVIDTSNISQEEKEQALQNIRTQLTTDLEELKGSNNKELKSKIAKNNANYIAQVSTSLGIEVKEAFTRINKAKDFTSLDDTHYTIATLHQFEGKVFSEIDIPLTILSQKQKQEFGRIPSQGQEQASDTAPKWFTSLPEWEQAIIIAKKDKITDGKHNIGTQLQEIPVIRNGYQKFTQRHFDNEPSKLLDTHFHTGSHHVNSKDQQESERLTKLTMDQHSNFTEDNLQIVGLLSPIPLINSEGTKVETLGKVFNTQEAEHYSNLPANIGRILVSNQDSGINAVLEQIANFVEIDPIVNTTSDINFRAAAFKEISHDELDNFVTSRPPAQSSINLNDILVDVDRSLDNEERTPLLANPTNVFNPIRDHINGKKVLSEKNFNGLVDKLGNHSQKEILKAAGKVRSLMEASFLGLDSENRNLQLATEFQKLSTLISQDPNSPQYQVCLECKSGKDRTGITEINILADAIAKELGVAKQTILEQGGSAFSAVFHPGLGQGGTPGCFGVKKEASTVLPKSWGNKVGQSFILETASGNNLKYDRELAENLAKQSGQEVDSPSKNTSDKSSISETAPKQNRQSVKTSGQNNGRNSTKQTNQSNKYSKLNSEPTQSSESNTARNTSRAIKYTGTLIMIGALILMMTGGFAFPAIALCLVGGATMFFGYQEQSRAEERQKNQLERRKELAEKGFEGKTQQRNQDKSQVTNSRDNKDTETNPPHLTPAQRAENRKSLEAAKRVIPNTTKVTSVQTTNQDHPPEVLSSNHINAGEGRQ